MDDDDFGGFEAAETFEGGNGQTQTTSPAIPWAAFPTVPKVNVPQDVSPDVFLEHSMAPTCFVSSDPFVLSNDNVLMDVQTATRILHPAALPEQIPLSTSPSLDIPISSLSLTEEKHLETSFIPRNDDEKQELNASKKHLRETIASIEKNWKAAEEEKYRIKQELEDLMEKHSMLEVDFLKEKEDKLISHQDRYKALQERHKHELEDMKKAGHDALSIIVEEFKALLQSTVEQREEVIEKQHITVIEKQAQKCEELLIAQHQRLLDMLDAEKDALAEKMDEALMQQSQKYKEMLEKCMEEERKRSKDDLADAVKIEKEVMEAAILKAVEEERRNMEKIHAEEREIWQAERTKDNEKIPQAIEDAVQEQRKNSQRVVKAAIMEEQKRSEKAVEEAVKKTREELMEYIKEQKRLDQVVRQRSLSSLELFLSCAQKQLNSLLNEEPVSEVQKRETEPLTSTDKE